MKNILFSIILLVFTSNICKADQLAYLSKDQAQKATTFLQTQTEVLLWCACCDNDTKIIVKVSKIYYEYTANKEFYHIFLEGIDRNGKQVKEELDLAYVHINKNGKAYCVGKELGFKCDPCTETFLWSDNN
jgi:hypothetical protein